MSQTLDPEVAEPVRIIEEVILEVRHDLVLPDDTETRLVEVRLQEEAWTNGAVAVGKLGVGGIHDSRDPLHLRSIAGEPFERSAVFIVPMMNRFSGRLKGSGEYWSSTVSSRYSSRK